MCTPCLRVATLCKSVLGEGDSSVVPDLRQTGAVLVHVTEVEERLPKGGLCVHLPRPLPVRFCAATIPAQASASLRSLHQLGAEPFGGGRGIRRASCIGEHASEHKHTGSPSGLHRPTPAGLPPRIT